MIKMDEMSNCPAVAMSKIDGSILLHDYDDKLDAIRWKQEGASHYIFRRGWLHKPAFVVTLLFIPLSIFFILYLQWHSAFIKPVSTIAENPDSITAPGPERDLKLLLQPEAHVSRDAEVRRFSWNITKSMRAPNGVQKEVYLINGMIKVQPSS